MALGILLLGLLPIILLLHPFWGASPDTDSTIPVEGTGLADIGKGQTLFVGGPSATMTPTESRLAEPTLTATRTPRRPTAVPETIESGGSARGNVTVSTPTPVATSTVTATHLSGQEDPIEAVTNTVALDQPTQSAIDGVTHSALKILRDAIERTRPIVTPIGTP